MHYNLNENDIETILKIFSSTDYLNLYSYKNMSSEHNNLFEIIKDLEEEESFLQFIKKFNLNLEDFKKFYFLQFFKEENKKKEEVSNLKYIFIILVIFSLIIYKKFF